MIELQSKKLEYIHLLMKLMSSNIVIMHKKEDEIYLVSSFDEADITSAKTETTLTGKNITHLLIEADYVIGNDITRRNATIDQINKMDLIDMSFHHSIPYTRFSYAR